MQLRPVFVMLWMSLGLSLAAFHAPSASANRFANRFAEFKLPSNWDCSLEGAEWVCQNKDANKRRDAIIILAAKLRGDQDSLEQYLTYLKQAKAYTSIKGQRVQSDVKYSKTDKINEQPWVDALHLESEIPGFYTRYLATVKNDIGILVTYSISKDKYSEYLPEFDEMVKTLKVFRRSGGLNAAPKDSNLFDAAMPTQLAQESVFPSLGGQAPTAGATPQKSQGDDDFFFYLAIGIVAAIVIVIVKKRRGPSNPG